MQTDERVNSLARAGLSRTHSPRRIGGLLANSKRPLEARCGEGQLADKSQFELHQQQNKRVAQHSAGL